MTYLLDKRVICQHLSLSSGIHKATQTGESGKMQILSHLPGMVRKGEGTFSYRIQVYEVHAVHCMCLALVHQTQETNPCDQMDKN